MGIAEADAILCIISVNKYLLCIYVPDTQPGTALDNETVRNNNDKMPTASQVRIIDANECQWPSDSAGCSEATEGMRRSPDVPGLTGKN